MGCGHDHCQLRPEPIGPVDAQRLIDVVTAFGPWFEVSRMDDATPAWEPAAEICASGDRIAELIEDCATRYSTANQLVGVSFLLKTYTARIAFPAIGCFIAERRVLDMSLRNVALRFSEGHATGVALRSPSFVKAEARPLALLHHMLVDHLAVTITSLQECSQARAGWLWSIVADTCASAFVRLSDGAAPLKQLQTEADALLDIPGSPLAGRGHVREWNGKLVLDRSSCCLYFTVPRGAYCDNCTVPRDRRKARPAD